MLMRCSLLCFHHAITLLCIQYATIYARSRIFPDYTYMLVMDMLSVLLLAYVQIYGWSWYSSVVFQNCREMYVSDWCFTLTLCLIPYMLIYIISVLLRHLWLQRYVCAPQSVFWALFLGPIYLYIISVPLCLTHRFLLYVVSLLLRMNGCVQHDLHCFNSSLIVSKFKKCKY